MYDLRCGISLLREKIERCFENTNIHYFCRNYLAEVFRENFDETNQSIQISNVGDGDYLLINGRFIFGDGEIQKIAAKSSQECVWKKNEGIIAARITGKQLASIIDQHDGVIPASTFDGLPKSDQEIAGDFIRYPWDLVNANAKQIGKDFKSFNRGGKIAGEIYPNVTLLNEGNIYIAAGAKIKPGVVLDAEEGPIFINENATIMPNAVLEGPAFIGKNSQVKIGAKIYEGTSIGEVCKVGGEVEESIIHSYSNKQHDGFLGHAYLGQWVNIGADSNNSDLKNNYGNVKVFINGEWIDSGSQFVGLFMGDHSKCAINTMFNTGTVVGVMCNVFGAGFPPKHISSFSWGGAENIEPYKIEKALEVARQVMPRRNKILSLAQEKMLISIFHK